MNYEDMSYWELDALMMEEHKLLDLHREKLGQMAHWRAVKAQEMELSKKLGSLGDSEIEMLRKLLSQTTTPAPIESAEDINL
jgi:hypothetical protein